MPEPSLLTCGQIARRIAITRGCCNPSSIWRVIKRLNLAPVQSTSHGENPPTLFYSEEQAAQIAAALRKPNRPTLVPQSAA